MMKKENAYMCITKPVKYARERIEDVNGEKMDH